MEPGVLDEAYGRLHATGPEFQGWLSNHGPMVAEAMVRRGHLAEVQLWLDRYVRRLEDPPTGVASIGPDWEEALGDPCRIADWTGYFSRSVRERPWRALLGEWWPRLLPGVAAAATHGVIRVGHAVRVLLDDGEDEARLAELAQGLGYWAARWQPVPGAGAGGSGAGVGAGTGLAEALADLPRIADRSGGIRERLDRLAELGEWPPALASSSLPGAPEEVPGFLADLVDAAVARYLGFGHGSAVMLVHSATAPNAIARILPALDPDHWVAGASAAWAATAALTAVYAPTEPAPPDVLPASPAGPGAAAETFARAVEHGDEHVIKLADTALDSYARSGNAEALAAVVRATTLVEPFPAA